MGRNMDYQRWFEELDELLVQHRDWWQIRPFHHRHIPWAETQPQLVAALAALTEAELARLEQDSQALADWLSPWLVDGSRLLELSVLPQAVPRPLSIPPRLDVSVPGRKWQQACRFVAARPASARPLLEWCSGKGHLGRLLAAVDGCAVTSFEWQQSLCEAGTELAQRLGLAQRFVQGDALAAEARPWVAAGGQAVALHACGDLHTTLMRHWVAEQGHSLTVSPCCYHLIQQEHYQPLSTAARCSALRLARADLSLPLQETVTAGEGDRRRREQDLWWRLSFDEWQRVARGVDEYLPVPTLSRSWLQGSFAEFCMELVDHHRRRHKLLLPAVTAADFEEELWLQRGRQRLAQVRRTELVAHLFRRPLEIWLALDRVLFLQDSGARVTLNEFCERTLTPRNILIHAER